MRRCLTEPSSLVTISFTGEDVRTCSTSVLGPVDPSCSALSEGLKFKVRRHKFNQDSLCSSVSCFEFCFCTGDDVRTWERAAGFGHPVSCFVFRVSGFRFHVSVFGHPVLVFGYPVSFFVFRPPSRVTTSAPARGLRVSCIRFRVSDLGFRV